MGTENEVDDFFSKVEIVRLFWANGQPIQAREYLLALIAEERLIANRKNDSAARLHYLIQTLLPDISNGGNAKSVLPAWVEEKLSWRSREISWAKWLGFFPGFCLEAMEDRLAGRTREVQNLTDFSADDLLAHKTGLFYSPNGFGPLPATGMLRRRSKNNLQSLNAVFVDLDGAGSAELKQKRKLEIQAFPRIPSFVVETKNGFHVIWLLERFVLPSGMIQWVEVQNGLIGHLGGDRACKDVSRLLRMPSSWHCKGLWTGGEAFPVRLVFESKHRYNLEDFSQWREVTKTYTKPTLSSVVAESVLYQPTISGIPKDSRHATLVREAGRVYQSAGDFKVRAIDCRQIVMDWYGHACLVQKSDWRVEAEQICDWLEREQFNL